MYTKKNTRVTFRSNRRPNFKRNNNFSGSKQRNKGNVTQQYNKYLKLAKEASSSGDRIQSEYYYQFTDHYYRMMLELGINLEENDNKDELLSDEINFENNDSLDEKKQEDPNSIEEASSDDNENLESIESIPFISEPIKKKLSKPKKVST